MSMKERITAQPDTRVVSFKARTNILYPEPDNETIYGSFDPENNKEDADLVESIRTIGLIQPITVRPHDHLSDEYYIVSGHRRLAAHIYLQITLIPVIVIQPTSEEDLMQLHAGLVQTNTMTRNRTPAIMAREIEYLKPVMKRLKEINPEKYAGISVREMIADKMSVSESTVKKIQTVLSNTTPETNAAFRKGEVSLAKALEEVQKNKEEKTTAKAQPDMEIRQISLVAEKTVQQEKEHPSVSADTMHHQHNQLLRAIVSVQDIVSDNPEIALDETFNNAVISLRNTAINYIRQKGATQ